MLTKPKGSFFDLSHDVKFTTNMGDLTPVCVMEAVPGDKFKIGAESLIRFAPLVSPVMHRMDATIHYFFVPNRILWKGWENFITNTPDTPGGTDIPAFPTLDYEALDIDDPVQGPQLRLATYLGLPRPNVSFPTQQKVSALPWQAYYRIWYDYYRDQNLQDEQYIPLDNGDNGVIADAINADRYQLRKRAWEHDYFTGSLPFAQKGPSVDIPLGEVKLNEDIFPMSTGLPHFRKITDGSNAGAGTLSTLTGGTIEFGGGGR